MYNTCIMYMCITILAVRKVGHLNIKTTRASMSCIFVFMLRWPIYTLSREDINF